MSGWAEIKIKHSESVTIVEVDGVDVSSQIRAIEVAFDADNFPVATIHYACETVDIVGGMDVLHVCPLEDDPDE